MALNAGKSGNIKFKKLLDFIGKHREGGHKWQSGNLSNTTVSTDLSVKYKKMCKTIGMHRHIDRLSKIKTDKELAEKIYEIASDKFRDDIKALRGFAEFLYKKVDENKFRGENEKILKDLYDAVNKFRKQKRDATTLPTSVTAFYDYVSVANNFDDFVDLVYENRRDKKGDFEVYLDELKSKNVNSFGKTKKIMINYNTPTVEEARKKVTMEVPTTFSMLKLETKNIISRIRIRAEKLRAQYKPLCDEFEDWLKKFKVPDAEKRVQTDFLMPLTGAALASPGHIKMLDEMWKGIFSCSKKQQVVYKKIFENLKSGIYYDTTHTNPKELGEVVSFIYNIYKFVIDEANADKTYNEKLSDLKYEIRKLEIAQSGQKVGAVKETAKRLNSTQKNISNNKGNDAEKIKSLKTNRNNGVYVAELRKKFENQDIMGTRIK